MALTQQWLSTLATPPRMGCPRRRADRRAPGGELAMTTALEPRTSTFRWSSS